MCTFGRPVRVFIPIHPGKYQPHTTWRETLASREEALHNRHMHIAEHVTEHTRTQPPLVGDFVRIQNQTGPNPTKWDKTGIVIEVHQFDLYVVRVDGSGRVTLRNRKFLRKYLQVIPRAPLAMAPGPTAIALPQVNLPTSITPQHDSFSSPSRPMGPPKTPCVYEESPSDPTNPLPDKPAPQASLSPTVPQPDQSP
ncbi:hypothetical protein Pcinc_025840 [Petrolisthes cinctipes]|uniref:Uncharacterized protein n=1 Tax=Petrolisthes cinctipes TaxID=88211 RepID=A0AAE1F8V8_PETCI|nr:hypothetical protein Pcinc_025840 [Petrolisthes cinctipes]